MTAVTAVKPSQRRDPASLYRDFESADFTRPRNFAVLVAVYYLVRAPFLNDGYGTDTDAWRVVLSGRELLKTGHYYPSRLPGNPLHDLVMALLAPGGWIVTGLATATVALIGVYIFAQIVKHINLPAQGLIVFAFAFAPLLLINSIATVDFMWTLTLLLGCYLCVLKGQTLLGGVLLGCAAGTRLQSPVFGPAVIALLWQQHRLRELPAFFLAAAGTALVAFAPVLVVYGRSFLNFYDAAVPYREVISLVGKEGIGGLGVVAVFIGAVFSLRRLARLPRDVFKDPYVASWIAVFICYTFTFLRLPHQVGYLIPTFPFGLMFLARYYTRPAVLGCVVCIILAGFFDLSFHGVDPSLLALRHATLGRGLILENRDTMNAQKAYVQQVMSDEVPDHSYVMIGYIFPVAAVREESRLPLRIMERDYDAISMLSDRGEIVDTRRDVHYVWLMPWDAFTALRSQGYNFYVVPDAEGGVYDLYHYRPTLFGASFLEIAQQKPAKSKEGENTGR